MSWGKTNPPFHHPVCVLTHHAREPLSFEGGTTVTFVTVASGQRSSRRGAPQAGRMSEWLLGGVGDDMHGLGLVRMVAAPKVTHLEFVRGR